ncbi:MAG: hypothetical protein AAF718_14820 [Pseudomonadota bacterium]
MVRTVCCLVLPVVLAVIAGPLSLAASSKSKPDVSHVYLVVGSRHMMDEITAQPGTREIGPYRAPFARLLQTNSDIHSSLVDEGYWLFPATDLARLCGVKL